MDGAGQCWAIGPKWTHAAKIEYRKLLFCKRWALNSAVECHLHTVEVIGSNPIAPTILPFLRTAQPLASADFSARSPSQRTRGNPRPSRNSGGDPMSMNETRLPQPPSYGSTEYT